MGQCSPLPPPGFTKNRMNDMKNYICPQSIALDITAEGLIAASTDTDTNNLGETVNNTVTKQSDYTNKFIWDNSEWPNK